MIYFDNAATTLQKPPTVAAAMRRAVTTAANPGRGAHQSAMRAAEIVYEAREAICELFNAPDPSRVIFTCNATHALNIAIRGLLAQPSNRNIILHSAREHNAVMRQLYYAEQASMKLRQFNVMTLSEYLPEARFLTLNHASNVFGTVEPAEYIAQKCAEYGIYLVLDAAQSCGHVNIDITKLPNTIVCVPGHKGLYGPQGTGFLILPENITLEPLLRGGTGSSSLLRDMPDEYPDRLEAGTLNIPGIAGLYEGVRYIQKKGTHAILEHEQKLLRIMVQLLKTLPQVRLFADGAISRAGEWQPAPTQLGVISFQVDSMDCEDVAAMLSERGIAVRAGLHCAPLAHINTPQGTVRVSFSCFNTEKEVRQFVRVMGGIVK